MELFGDFFLILLVILGTTFVQKYYYLLLHKMKDESIFLSAFIGFIIRFWVIIHEFCHMFFWFLSGNKLKEISLFDKNWGKVVYETKNYIWHLSEYGLSLNYIFLLIFNQIWIFLTSFWPLIVGVGVSFFLFQYLWITDIQTLKSFDFEYKSVFILIIYSIFIPSFVLSYEDISKFFISRQYGIFSTFLGSIINTAIFVGFMVLFSSFIVNFVVFFWIIFLGMFTFQICLYLLFYLFKKIF